MSNKKSYLRTMDYEKFKEAKRLYQTANSDQKYVLESLFPELKEDEDEKNIKDLIDELKCSLRAANCQNDACGGGHEKRIALLEWSIDWLEKQGEQKSTNKNEPKFHKDEWVTNGDYTWKIVDVKPLDYILQSQDGNIVDDTISYVDEQFHSFTIQDARDGDVIQLGEVTAIFKEVIGNGNCRCYCSVCNGEFEIPSQDGADNSYGYHDIKPATKEQCDQLEKEMVKAGHKWNKEKHVLEKITKEKHYIEFEIQDDSFIYNDKKYNCHLAIKTDKDCIIREAKNSYSDFEELYDKSTLTPKKVRVFFNEQEDILYGMIIYTIRYRKDKLERSACGNYYPIREGRLMPHLYQGSICW